MVERYKKARLLENSLCIFDIDIDRIRVSKLLTLASYFFKLWTTAIFLIGCSIGRESVIEALLLMIRHDEDCRLSVSIFCEPRSSKQWAGFGSGDTKQVVRKPRRTTNSFSFQ
jgi:hypothetical protein